MPRPISIIAREIFADWRPVHPWARPYAEAMLDIETVSSTYGVESGRDIVTYFLSNATTWKGDVARKIKKELKEMLK